MRAYFSFKIISIFIFFVPITLFAQSIDTKNQEKILSELSRDLSDLHNQISRAFTLLKERTGDKTNLSQHIYFQVNENVQIMREPSKDSAVLFKTTRPTIFRIIFSENGWYEVLFLKPSTEISISEDPFEGLLERVTSGWIEASKGSVYNKIELQPGFVFTGEESKGKGIYLDDWIDKNSGKIIAKLTEPIFEWIINTANKFKTKYENNPLVYVSGFTLDVGASPSLSISFEFKKGK